MADCCTAQMLQVTPSESPVPPIVPVAEPSPQQQHAACQVMLLTQSTQSLSPLPPHFPWQEERRSNTLCTATASLPVPEPVLSTHTQRKMRLGLLHTLCDRATATGTLPTTWDLPSCIFFRHLHARVRMGQERCPLQGSPR